MTMMTTPLTMSELANTHLHVVAADDLRRSYSEERHQHDREESSGRHRQCFCHPEYSDDNDGISAHGRLQEWKVTSK